VVCFYGTWKSWITAHPDAYSNFDLDYLQRPNSIWEKNQTPTLIGPVPAEKKISSVQNWNSQFIPIKVNFILGCGASRRALFYFTLLGPGANPFKITWKFVCAPRQYLSSTPAKPSRALAYGSGARGESRIYKRKSAPQKPESVSQPAHMHTLAPPRLINHTMEWLVAVRIQSKWPISIEIFCGVAMISWAGGRAGDDGPRQYLSRVSVGCLRPEIMRKMRCAPEREKKLENGCGGKRSENRFPKRKWLEKGFEKQTNKQQWISCCY